jgi:hypothetical protein
MIHSFNANEGRNGSHIETGLDGFCYLRPCVRSLLLRVCRPVCTSQFRARLFYSLQGLVSQVSEIPAVRLKLSRIKPRPSTEFVI